MLSIKFEKNVDLMFEKLFQIIRAVSVLLTALPIFYTSYPTQAACITEFFSLQRLRLF